MKPASFTYHRPANLDELFELMDTYMDDSKIIAGGQSLVPMMNMRLSRPENLIDIGQLQGLNGIEENGEKIKIGALCTQVQLEESELLKNKCPIVPYTVSKIGHYAIRQRGTIGGSIVHADPSAELPLLASLLHATITISSSEGIRTVGADEFFLTIYTTDIMPNELLTEIEIPVLPSEFGWSYTEFSRRVGDFAIVSVGTILSVDEENRIQKINMALGGAEDIPLNVTEKVEDFIGESASEDVFHSIAREAVSDINPQSDIHASAAFRAELLETLIEQSLNEALSRTKIGGI